MSTNKRIVMNYYKPKMAVEGPIPNYIKYPILSYILIGIPVMILAVIYLCLKDRKKNKVNIRKPVSKASQIIELSPLSKGFGHDICTFTCLGTYFREDLGDQDLCVAFIITDLEGTKKLSATVHDCAGRTVMIETKLENKKIYLHIENPRVLFCTFFDEEKQIGWCDFVNDDWEVARLLRKDRNQKQHSHFFLKAPNSSFYAENSKQALSVATSQGLVVYKNQPFVNESVVKHQPDKSNSAIEILEDESPSNLKDILYFCLQKPKRRIIAAVVRQNNQRLFRTPNGIIQRPISQSDFVGDKNTPVDFRFLMRDVTREYRVIDLNYPFLKAKDAPRSELSFQFHRLNVGTVHFRENYTEDKKVSVFNGSEEVLKDVPVCIRLIVDPKKCAFFPIYEGNQHSEYLYMRIYLPNVDGIELPFDENEVKMSIDGKEMGQMKKDEKRRNTVLVPFSEIKEKTKIKIFSTYHRGASKSFEFCAEFEFPGNWKSYNVWDKKGTLYVVSDQSKKYFYY